MSDWLIRLTPYLDSLTGLVRPLLFCHKDEVAKGDVIIYMDDILIAIEGSLNAHKKHVVRPF